MQKTNNIIFNKSKILIIVNIILLFLLIDCKQKVNKLAKESIAFEIPLEEITFVSKNPEKKDQGGIHYPLDSPPIQYFNNFLYLSSNGKNKKLTKISKNGQNISILGSKKTSSKVRVIGNNQRNAPKQIRQLKFHQFNFDYILKFAPGYEGELYVVNLYIPDGKKTDPKKEKKPQKQKPKKATPSKTYDYEEDDRDNPGQETKPKTMQNTKKAATTAKIPYSRYIYKFSSKGEYLYKIGSKGKEGAPFTEAKIFYSINCDKNNNLYVILKSQPSRQSKNDSMEKIIYELLRYNSSGILDSHIKDLSTAIPKNKDYNAVIEQIKVTQASNKLLFLVNYYPKANDKKKITHKPKFKKLFFQNLDKNQPGIEELRTFSSEVEKNYSILDVTDKDEIYLKTLSTYTEDIYKFQVLDKSGSYLKPKTIAIERSIDIEYTWYSLVDRGEIIAFQKTSSNIICNFYKKKDE